MVTRQHLWVEGVDPKSLRSGHSKISIESAQLIWVNFTPPKFNSEFTPEKLPKPKKKVFFQPSFFRGELLNFGGVDMFLSTSKFLKLLSHFLGRTGYYLGQQTLDLLGRCEWKKLNKQKFPPNGGEQMEMNPMVEPIRKESPTKEIQVFRHFWGEDFPLRNFHQKPEKKKKNEKETKTISRLKNHFRVPTILIC